MHKKPVVPQGPVADLNAATVLGSGAITPAMQKILSSMEHYNPSAQEATEQFFRDAVGKLFLAALEQMYHQQEPNNSNNKR